ncbi:Polyadenylate-binding protein, cytoplasmic and nuclear [Symbiodinium microadriaticum]|uniref:Polyadenylate-binding protein, cytoplasmic and nuclear n=1 Tax=Symbiodinium microadriaticum TaxID=2951 RepID=A0A1Q9E1F1_SYMMI|nr:Polyadenylate-binding protein, cytoplasmic and nuclear [Symbiodinium microadriaticum]
MQRHLSALTYNCFAKDHQLQPSEAADGAAWLPDPEVAGPGCPQSLEDSAVPMPTLLAVEEVVVVVVVVVAARMAIVFKRGLQEMPVDAESGGAVRASAVWDQRKDGDSDEEKVVLDDRSQLGECLRKVGPEDLLGFSVEAMHVFADVAAGWTLPKSNDVLGKQFPEILDISGSENVIVSISEKGLLGRRNAAVGAAERAVEGSWVVEVNGVVENLEAMRCELEAKPSKQLQSKAATISLVVLVPQLEAASSHRKRRGSRTGVIGTQEVTPDRKRLERHRSTAGGPGRRLPAGPTRHVVDRAKAAWAGVERGSSEQAGRAKPGIRFHKFRKCSGHVSERDAVFVGGTCETRCRPKPGAKVARRRTQCLVDLRGASIDAERGRFLDCNMQDGVQAPAGGVQQATYIGRQLGSEGSRPRETDVVREIQRCSAAKVIPHAKVKGEVPLCRCNGYCKCGLADALGRAREDHGKWNVAQPALRISNLHPAVTEEMLYSLFTELAPVATLRVVRDTKTLESELHGFVNFHTFNDAQNVLEDGRDVNIVLAAGARWQAFAWAPMLSQLVLPSQARGISGRTSYPSHLVKLSEKATAALTEGVFSLCHDDDVLLVGQLGMAMMMRRRRGEECLARLPTPCRTPRRKEDGCFWSPEDPFAPTRTLRRTPPRSESESTQTSESVPAVQTAEASVQTEPEDPEHSEKEAEDAEGLLRPGSCRGEQLEPRVPRRRRCASVQTEPEDPEHSEKEAEDAEGLLRPGSCRGEQLEPRVPRRRLAACSVMPANISQRSWRNRRKAASWSGKLSSKSSSNSAEQKLQGSSQTRRRIHRDPAGRRFYGGSPVALAISGQVLAREAE